MLIEVDEFVEVEDEEGELFEGEVFGCAVFVAELLDEMDCAIDFGGGWGSRNRKREGERDLGAEVVWYFFAQSRGEDFCFFVNPVAVEHQERLGGLGGGEARGAGEVGVGGVEGDERGNGEGAL